MKTVFITGGAGFIGVNASAYFLRKKWRVIIFDKFSRPGSRNNAAWLKKLGYGTKLKIIEGDIVTNNDKLNKEIKGVDLILHLAGQVAVTTSVLNPREDFESNALGTLNVLESMRTSAKNAVLIYASTNKVYGGLEYEKVKETKTRYEFKNLPKGVNEKIPVDFHSPYGCSKGAADQYVHDFNRIYGLKTIVFRQSCIYGEHQYGIEDQGWLAWFMIALQQGKQITIYGTGKQVRDVLYIGDLLDAYYRAYKAIKITNGQIYNIGGGIQNTISIWYEFIPLLEKHFKTKVRARFVKARPGDQPIYVSDTHKAHTDFGWQPNTNIEKGIAKLYDWISTNKNEFNFS